MKTLKIAIALFSITLMSSCGSLRKSDCGLGKMENKTNLQQTTIENEADS